MQNLKKLQKRKKNLFFFRTFFSQLWDNFFNRFFFWVALVNWINEWFYEKSHWQKIDIVNRPSLIIFGYENFEKNAYQHNGKSKTRSKKWKRDVFFIIWIACVVLFIDGTDLLSLFQVGW